MVRAGAEDGNTQPGSAPGQVTQGQVYIIEVTEPNIPTSPGGLGRAQPLQRDIGLVRRFKDINAPPAGPI